jgi:superkiller protein 3
MSEARTVYREAFQHFAKGELTQAIAGYQRAIELDERLAIAWNGLSMALAQQGNLDEAIDAAHRLVALEPEDPLSHTNLSRLLQQKGLVPEAEEAMARATQLQMGSG